MIAEHPGWEELQAYGQGRLAPELALTLEEHLAGCESCCELLEKAAGDSFLTQLRAADSAGPGEPDRDTDADATGATAAEAATIPLELVDHPRYRVLELVG